MCVKSVGKRDASWEDFVNEFPKDDCIYAIYDFNYETNEVPKRKVSKIVYFYWAPEGSKIKAKMVYSSA